jgi:acetyl esterase/lipase
MKKLLFFLMIVYVPLFAQEKADTVEYQEILNLSYLSPEDIEVDSLQQLNLLLPKGVENPPLLLWIGGGAWSFVNRHIEMNLARKFARKGIAVASVGHRLSMGSFRATDRTSGVKHPAHIQDIASAFKWLHEHAKEYQYDAENLFVGGFSSGAHLAALLAMDSSYLAAHGLKTEHIKGIIPVAGTYDINDYYSVFFNHESPDSRALAETHVKDVFGEESGFTAASPVTYLEHLQTPMLLISENGLYNYTKLFEEHLWASEYRDCQILHVFNFNHAGLWRDISNAPNSQTRNIMIDFIRFHAASS